MGESIHKGHRERLRRRFVEYGLDSFTDIEAIELLLFFALPRRDTNVLAHELLRAFGNFRGVMEACADDLKKVDGIGESAAQLIRLTAELGRRYLLECRPVGKPICGSNDAGAYMIPLFMYETREQMFVLCMDDSGKVLQCRKVAQGMADKVDFSARDVADIALRSNASRVIVAHNHPNGSAAPSPADISATKRLKTALGMIDIGLFDHIIVSGTNFVSLKDRGCL